MTFDKAWDDWHRERRGVFPNEHFVRFVAREFAEARARFLDLGCGQGAQTFFLLDRHHFVEAVDGSAPALQPLWNWHLEMRSELLRITRADLLGISLAPASVDCIVDCATLQHLSQRESWQAVQAARDWLKPGGWFWSWWSAPGDASWKGTPAVDSPAPYQPPRAEIGHIFNGYKTAVGEEVVYWEDDRIGRPMRRHWIIEAHRGP